MIFIVFIGYKYNDFDLVLQAIGTFYALHDILT